MIRPGQAKGPYVGFNGTTSGFAPSNATFLVVTASAALSNERVFNVDTGMTILDGGANGLFTISPPPVNFRDDFLFEKSFWSDKQVLTSGDWQVASNYLEGLAQNNSQDDFRYHIEGDFDYAMKISQLTAGQIGFTMNGNSKTALISKVDTTLQVRYTGVANQDITITDTDPMWIRMRRSGTSITMF